MSLQYRVDLVTGATTKARSLSASRLTAEEQSPGQLEVNVIFTNPEATALALKYAASFATDLTGRIRLRAAIVVPLQLPFDQPPVSISFMERLLSDLVCRMKDASRATVHLYLCRNRLQTLLQVLSPNSLVIIGGRKRWWPTTESRTVKVLQSKGHRVVFVSLRRGADAVGN